MTKEILHWVSKRSLFLFLLFTFIFLFIENSEARYYCLNTETGKMSEQWQSDCGDGDRKRITRKEYCSAGAEGPIQFEAHCWMYDEEDLAYQPSTNESSVSLSVFPIDDIKSLNEKYKFCAASSKKAP